jgi:hypothetical protein
MRILLFALTVICFACLGIYRERQESEQRRAEQAAITQKLSYDRLTEQSDRVRERSEELRRAITAINQVGQQSKAYNDSLASLQSALEQATTQATQIQQQIAQLPKPKPMPVGVVVTGGTGESPDLKRLTIELQAAQKNVDDLRARVANLPPASPDANAIKDVVLGQRGPGTENPAESPQHTPTASGGAQQEPGRYWVQVAITLAFGLSAIIMIFKPSLGSQNVKNREWAFATIGTIIGFWLHGS